MLQMVNATSHKGHLHFVERRNAFGMNIVKCITYDPPAPTKPGINGGVGIVHT